MPIALAALWGCSSAPQAPAPPTGTLLFVSERDAGATAWAVRADGTGAVALPDLPGREFPGAADPRATHALLVTSLTDARGHSEQLWKVLLPHAGPHAGSSAGSGGGDPQKIGPPAPAIRNPAWVAGGSAIVFESSANSFRDLYRAPRDGGEVVRLTDQTGGSFEPSPGPADRFAFGTSRDGNAEIYAMRADGSEVVRLTDHPSDDIHPAWSPDGVHIAWIAVRDGVPRVWIMASDGSGARPLRTDAPEGSQDLDQVWSPDGKTLAVVVRTGPKEAAVHVIEAASGRRVGTVDGPGTDEHPTFSPDGRWIAVSRSRPEGASVVIAAPDGQHERTITAGGPTEWLPRWVGGGS